MANQPSGPGPTTKANSLSVTSATDDPGNLAEQNIDADLDAVKTSLASIDTKMPAWSVAFSTALAAKLIVKATAGRLKSASGRIDSTAPSGTYYVQVWNAVDVPADATVVGSSNSLMAPQKIVHVLGSDDAFEVDFGDLGKSAGTGITFGLSSTEFTKTASGAYLSMTAEYA